MTSVFCKISTPFLNCPIACYLICHHWHSCILNFIRPIVDLVVLYCLHFYVPLLPQLPVPPLDLFGAWSLASKPRSQWVQSVCFKTNSEAIPLVSSYEAQSLFQSWILTNLNMHSSRFLKKNTTNSKKHKSDVTWKSLLPWLSYGAQIGSRITDKVAQVIGYRFKIIVTQTRCQ